MHGYAPFFCFRIISIIYSPKKFLPIVGRNEHAGTETYSRATLRFCFIIGEKGDIPRGERIRKDEFGLLGNFEQPGCDLQEPRTV